ncbi:AGR279Cp [Eremothecium gossypii ATCC 10895]|uniref:Endoribonuclease YSH1 n=1 Tax=Eremothecium gossypii (strain ATCC 10895 / CBS 109.51 / FGSC 9923 / NRRL Y-1056) TaxID=284811 RepID=YSH1_EREGS|nr:AGR279Cp [Eremothecium gossypii ATCC 10895]Q74ZC0.2 RecName: Full=Endoribonuclease YSH1; AltName: Full=mRNA 3'-end-processing protein YSH1 [Eremothecium gossypii ATCC 10895]AAS54769.2 AGR279Cp [Eremothecium gossypii ATCC 10895]
MTEEKLDTNSFRFFGLGGSNEVGRSCHILQYKGKTVMLDAGVHPAHQGIASLPFYDEFDLSQVEVLLISHFHLDHAASLPYVMQRTNFQGRVFMTHPTKAIYRWLLSDFVKVTNIGNDNAGGVSDENLYTDEDLAESFDRIETVDYHSTIDVNGIKFTAYHAGHVLGAAMFQVEIAGLRILFTGDYSRELDRHLNSAEIPTLPSDILIVESTFGTATHEPRTSKEKKLTQLIHTTVSKGGRVLLPVFALGRAQEIMLILDEYWSQHAEQLGNGQVPIFYASNLARKCMSVFQTYVNMMNDKIRKKFRDSQTNPFIFKNISYLKNLDEFQDFGPSVMLASPGMLQNGLSRDLLEKWCPDEKNLVLITGYSVEGTMAKFLMLEPETIPSINNSDVSIPRRCQVEEISFAAHVDFRENLEFVEKIGAPNIILVHGESNPMGRLKSALLSNFSSLKGTEDEVRVYNPRNCVAVDLEFKGVKIAKAVGNIVDEMLPVVDEDKERPYNDPEDATSEEQPKEEPQDADKLPEEREQPEVEEERVISGILVSDEKNFDLNLVSLSDLREHHTDLSTTVLKERQTVHVDCRNELIFWHLCQMFGDIEVLVDEEGATLTKVEEDEKNTKPGQLVVRVMGDIKLSVVDHVATLEWTQNVISDAVADSIVAILLSVDSSPASVKRSSHSCNSNDHPGESETLWKIKQIAKLFNEQFGDSFTLLLDKESEHSDNENIKGSVTIGKNYATVNFSKMAVEDCNSNPLKGRIESILGIGADLVAPLC